MFFSCSTVASLLAKEYIYGAAGMGKSGLCRHIAHTWALGQSKLSRQFDYVFPMPMRAIRSHSLVDMICKDTKLIPESSQQRIEQELELKSVLFILASFEELAHTTPKINKLIRRELYPKSSVVITARPGHKLEEEEHESAPCIKADLQNLTEEQVKGYMANYRGLHRNVQLEMEKRFGMGFLRKPINLWLLCLLVAQIAMSADMPNSQTILLNMIIQRLMLAYSKKRNLPDLNLTPESPYKRQKLSELNLTSDSPLKNAPIDVKLLLKEVGGLCYCCLRDQESILHLDDGVLSKADVMAMGLFSEGPDDNSVELPHPLFQEYLAALFLSVDKRARQDLFKELREESQESSSRPSLVELLRPRGFDNMVRFLVGLSPGVAKVLSQLCAVKQIKYAYGVYQHDFSYELDLIRECSVEERRSVIAAAVLEAPVSVRGKYSTARNTDSHLLLHHYSEEQQQTFLKKFYGCQICSHELVQASDSGHFWLDSFVVGMLFLHKCTVKLKKAFFTDCHVSVSMLTDRLAAVEDLTLKDSILCDLTEAHFLSSLNLTSLFHSSTTGPPRKLVSLSSVELSRVKGVNLFSPPHCKLPTSRMLKVAFCSDVDLGSLCRCFTGVSELNLWSNKHVELSTGQWFSVRKLHLLSCDRVDLIRLKKMFTRLVNLKVEFTALRVETRGSGRQPQWRTVKDLALSPSQLYMDERVLNEKEAREFLTRLCPEAKVDIRSYGLPNV